MYVAYIDGERDGWCIAFLGRHYCGPFHSEEEARAFAAGLNEEMTGESRRLADAPGPRSSSMAEPAAHAAPCC